MRRLFATSFLLVSLAGTPALFAQQLDSLKAVKAEKETQLAALKAEVDALSAAIKKLQGPAGWQFGSTGTLGINFSNFNNWLGSDAPNTFASTIGFSGSAFANLDAEKFFWRNSGLLNVAKTKFDPNTDDDVDADFETSADAFGLSSLYGQKISPTFAFSALADFRTTILSNFGNPGFLDLGTGATWKPVNNLVVVAHPLNYNIVFSKSGTQYNSSLGAKVVVDYSQQLPKGISWKSNLSAFLSYKDFENLSNWIWTNGFSLKVWKSLGVGFEFGLKKNKQEAYNYKLKTEGLDPATFKIDDLSSDDNPLQTYWLLGLTYKL